MKSQPISLSDNLAAFGEAMKTYEENMGEADRFTKNPSLRSANAQVLPLARAKSALRKFLARDLPAHYEPIRNFVCGEINLIADMERQNDAYASAAFGRLCAALPEGGDW